MKLYRLIFVSKAFLLLVSICLINHGITIGKILNACGITGIPFDLPDILSYVIYLVIPIILSYCNHKRFPKLDHVNIEECNIVMIESASALFLPTFFAYVFVGLSINNFAMLAFAYIALTVLCYCAEIYLYNPIFHLLGYRFFFVTVDKNKVLVMTKKEIRLEEHVEFKQLGRVNDFTYIDLEKKN